MVYTKHLQVCNEFARLMADESILDSGINWLLQLTPSILHYACQKKSPLVKEYLNLLDQEDDGMADNNDESDTDITDGKWMNIHLPSDQFSLFLMYPLQLCIQLSGIIRKSHSCRLKHQGPLLMPDSQIRTNCSLTHD